MSINATLITQMIVFGLLVWFTMKFVWPIIMGAMQEREKRIADGLAAGEQGQRDLREAKDKAAEELRIAREKAMQIIEGANRRADELVEEARAKARAEGERLIAGAHAEIEQETHRVRKALRSEVAAIAVAGAAQILEREIDAGAHGQLLDKLVAEL